MARDRADHLTADGTDDRAPTAADDRTRSRRLIVGITGASGVRMGVRLLEVLCPLPVETHLVLSRAASMTLTYETQQSPGDVRDLADVVHAPSHLGASIASGSFRSMGMLVVPCSVRTLSEIAYGQTSSLLTRAADVVLKERRRLVLSVRESPLHVGHLQAMLRVSEMGGIIAPPVPSYYIRPTSIEEIIDHSIGRLLDLFDIEHGLVRRWGEDVSAEPVVVRE
jgi:4-hydroxy-3-polyprenylbenzoate decarboxylase